MVLGVDDCMSARWGPHSEDCYIYFSLQGQLAAYAKKKRNREDFFSFFA